MNKQMFLQKLGMTDGEWKNENGMIMTSNYRPDYICQTHDNLYNDYCNAKQNSNLICAAPDMLIFLINELYFVCLSCRHTPITLLKKCEDCYDYSSIQLIKKATGKSWEEVLTIWNECQDDEGVNNDND